MNREHAIQQLRKTSLWDVIVIGGGASGLGAAVDAATRGYKTLLLERADFAQGTSSRSTKLSHGGVRYLKQGRLRLVMQSLRERGRMLENAPLIVRQLPFVIPVYSVWDKLFYGLGLYLYDLLAGSHRLARSKLLNVEQTLNALPKVRQKGLKGGIQYQDAQFDDAKLAICMAATAVSYGAVVLNYFDVVGFLKDAGRVSGVIAEDKETGEQFSIPSRSVLNATGIFVDELRRSEDPNAKPLLTVSQGSHIVLPKEFLPGENAMLVPRTDDGRVLYAIPWLDRVLVGTTDVVTGTVDREPVAREDEINFILRNASRYLTKAPQKSDVLSVFSGQRPLIRSTVEKNTAKLSRDHLIVISKSGLVTITGGKWTSYRHMAEDAINRISSEGKLPPAPCLTASLALFGIPRAHGWTRVEQMNKALRELCHSDPHLTEPVHIRLVTCRGIDVIRAARYEMARTVEDVLSRRTRSLLIDAKASMEAAPAVAEILAKELGKSDEWKVAQISEFVELANGYLPKPT